jgi:hypothetical protein
VCVCVCLFSVQKKLDTIREVAGRIGEVRQLQVCFVVYLCMGRPLCASSRCVCCVCLGGGGAGRNTHAHTHTHTHTHTHVGDAGRERRQVGG